MTKDNRYLVKNANACKLFQNKETEFCLLEADGHFTLATESHKTW